MADYKIEFERDCKGYPLLESYIPHADRIIAIGDIHGDAQVMYEMLKKAKVINDKKEWIGGSTHVVQVGDQIDRCRSSNSLICGDQKKCKKMNCLDPDATFEDESSDLEILDFLTKLDIQAREHGGRVINLLGNHEIMNIDGNLLYVSCDGLGHFSKQKQRYIKLKMVYDECKKLHNDCSNKKEELMKIAKEGAQERKIYFRRGGEGAKKLACTRTSCVIIGNCLFVHAGIVPELLTKMDINNVQDFDKLNEQVRKWMLGSDNSNIKKIIDDQNISPFWPRLFSMQSSSDDEQKLNKVFKVINIGPRENASTFSADRLSGIRSDSRGGHMIVGHTPQIYINNQGINSAYNGKVWRVDIGASRAFHPLDEFVGNKNLLKDKIQVLEILMDKSGKTTFNIIK